MYPVKYPHRFKYPNSMYQLKYTNRFKLKFKHPLLRLLPSSRLVGCCPLPRVRPPLLSLLRFRPLPS